MLCIAEMSTEDFVDYLDNIGVEDRVVKRAYGITVASMNAAPAMLQDEDFQMNLPYLNTLAKLDQLRRLLDQIGFLDLDPEGVNRISSKF